MSIEFRTATADDAEAIFRSDGRAFGFIWTEEQQQERIASLPFERFQLALDGAEVVAVAGAMPFDMTMPGGATVPACGVTWVGVQATHRRRGLLTELMGRVHADALSRGEPVSILHASEAAIYGRFGYGVSTLERAVRIDRARTRWRAERPAAGAARYADGPDARRRQEALWERGRRQRPGDRRPIGHPLAGFLDLIGNHLVAHGVLNNGQRLQHRHPIVQQRAQGSSELGKGIGGDDFMHHRKMQHFAVPP